MTLSSRQYVKRVWRVPKDKGPAVYLAALVHKALVKHGWPARVEIIPRYLGEGFRVEHIHRGGDLPPDMADAVAIAARIAAAMYRVEVEQDENVIILQKRYVVTSGGFFREAPE